MIEEPDYVHTSGRELLSREDRCALLAAEFVELQAAGPQWRKDMTNGELTDVHAWASFLGLISNASVPMVALDKYRSGVECLVLAWRRGGMHEWRRVRDRQKAA